MPWLYLFSKKDLSAKFIVEKAMCKGVIYLQNLQEGVQQA